jgi:tetratricopeptide (TPR) repeat protein
MSFEKCLLAAQGYLELDMPVEAMAELDSMAPDDRDLESALQLRLFIAMKSHNLEESLRICERLRQIYPEAVSGYIHGAFCLHERGQTDAALNLLLSGPPSLAEEATYFYNLACYSAVLGDLEGAADYAQRSFAMDDKFRDIAKLDPDLIELRDQM